MLDSDFIDDADASPNRIRLDETDRAILRELAADARVPNNVLAERVGVAPSTCLGRVRALRAAGVIRGFHADIDLEAVGLTIFALVSVRVHSQARDRMRELGRSMQALPSVLSVFVLAGDRDFVLHVACRSPSHLRDFIAEHLGSNPAVANTQTSLVFEQLGTLG